MNTVEALPEIGSAQLRIALAKDVIASLETERIISKSGSWVQIESDESICGFNTSISGSDDTQIQDIINNKKCQVCALGALFIESIRRFDSLTIGDLEDGYSVGCYDITEYLDNIFDEYQLKLIEVAYERGDGGFSVRWDFRDKEDREEAERAIEFGKTIDDDRERLIAIMNNIIKNYGDFIPPKVTTCTEATQV